MPEITDHRITAFPCSLVHGQWSFGPVVLFLAPNRTVLHRIAPYRTQSHLIAPYRTVSHLIKVKKSSPRARLSKQIPRGSSFSPVTILSICFQLHEPADDSLRPMKRTCANRLATVSPLLRLPRWRLGEDRARGQRCSPRRSAAKASRHSNFGLPALPICLHPVPFVVKKLFCVPRCLWGLCLPPFVDLRLLSDFGIRNSDFLRLRRAGLEFPAAQRII